MKESLWSAQRLPKSIASLLLMLCSSTLLSSCVHRIMLLDLPQRLSSLTKTSNSSFHKKPEAAKIWFVRGGKNGMSMISVRRRITGQNKIEDAVRELLSGPSSAEAGAGLGSEIPRGTVFLGVKEKNGEIELNLSRRFAAGAADSMETRLAQLSRTVESVAEKQAVYLDIEGKRLAETPGEGIEIPQPINK